MTIQLFSCLSIRSHPHIGSGNIISILESIKLHLVTSTPTFTQPCPHGSHKIKKGFRLVLLCSGASALLLLVSGTAPHIHQLLLRVNQVTSIFRFHHSSRLHIVLKEKTKTPTLPAIYFSTRPYKATSKYLPSIIQHCPTPSPHSHTTHISGYLLTTCTPTMRPPFMGWLLLMGAWTEFKQGQVHRCLSRHDHQHRPQHLTSVPHTSPSQRHCRKEWLQGNGPFGPPPTSFKDWQPTQSSLLTPSPLTGRPGPALELQRFSPPMFPNSQRVSGANTRH